MLGSSWCSGHWTFYDKTVEKEYEHRKDSHAQIWNYVRVIFCGNILKYDAGILFADLFLSHDKYAIKIQILFAIMILTKRLSASSV